MEEHKQLSVQFSCSIMSDSLWPHESQHVRLPCPSPTPRVHSESHPSSWWCHPAISSSVVPFSSCPQPLPAAAPAAKSLQSCPTLCDPIDSSPPGSAVAGILQARTLEWVAISFSSIRVFSNESTLHMRWPKYWSFSFSIIPSKQHPGLISFRMDWLDLLAVQGTLKSLLQHHSSKASILQHSAFFIVHFHIHTWPLEKP